MDFVTKNDLVQRLKSAGHFPADLKLLEKTAPGSKILRKHRNTTELGALDGDSDVLFELFNHGVTENEVLAGRNPQQNAQNGNESEQKGNDETQNSNKTEQKGNEPAKNGNEKQTDPLIEQAKAAAESKKKGAQNKKGAKN